MTPDEPECPAPPCLDTPEFVQWCKDNAGVIAGFVYIWHDKSVGQQYFFFRSHAVALDAEGDPLQCAQLLWAPPQAIANIENFLRRLRQYVAQAAKP